MKNILYHLYHGNLNEAEKSTKKLQETEEFKKYDEYFKKLTATFSKKQEKLFDEYFEWGAAYTEIEKERLYASGVKTGMCLVLELINFEPTL